MRIPFSIFFFLTFFGQGFGQISSHKVDSLRAVVHATTGDAKSEALLRLGYQFGSSNPDSTFALLSQALQVAKTREMRGRVYFEKSLLGRSLGLATQQAKFLDSAY